jgi:hypothetical protein
MNRTDIINHLIKAHNYKSYLEIGVWDKDLNFNKINCEEKYWNDPRPELIKQPRTTNEIDGYPWKSDEMFEKLDSGEIKQRKFDIIFIDGYHHAEQVIKDINNSLRYLSDNGRIVIHDCNPPIEDMAKEEWILNEWCGTVWKGWIQWRMENYKEFFTYTVNTDYGCGIIRKMKLNFSLKKPELNLTWEFFDKNRISLLNLVPEEYFLKIE